MGTSVCHSQSQKRCSCIDIEVRSPSSSKIGEEKQSFSSRTDLACILVHFAVNGKSCYVFQHIPVCRIVSIFEPILGYTPGGCYHNPIISSEWLNCVAVHFIPGIQYRFIRVYS